MPRTVTCIVEVSCSNIDCPNTETFRASNNSEHYACGANAEKDCNMQIYRAGWHWKEGSPGRWLCQECKPDV